MPSIAICDDEKIYSDAVSEILLKANLHADMYTSGKELVQSGKKYDIYILDIEMPEMDGMQTAMHIRSKNKNVPIIFLTNHDSYVFEGYEVNAFRYILKNNLAEKLPEALEKALLVSNARQKSIVFEEKGGGVVKILLSEIIMAEKYQKKVLFYLLNGEVIDERMTIAEAEQLLDSPDFILVRKGVIVNIKHIRQFEDMCLTLVTGRTCYVSRNQIKNVKDRILRLWQN